MKSAGVALISALGLVAGIVADQALRPEPRRLRTSADVRTPIDALKEVAVRQARESLGKDDATSRSRTAASIFFGACSMNTRARPEYCRQRDVDLRPFVAAYEEVHRAERRARGRSSRKRA